MNEAVFASRKAPRKIGHPERDIQIRSVRWILMQYPGTLLTMSPSGIKPGGSPKQIMIQRFNWIRMGYRKGTADLMIFEPRGKFHGLFVEIKTEDGVLSDEQRQFLQEAANRGYCAVACFGYDSVERNVREYMEQKA